MSSRLLAQVAPKSAIRDGRDLSLPVLMLLALCLAVSGCRTTGNHPTEREPSIDTSLKAAARATTLPLTKDEEQDLYLKLLTVETGAGQVVPREQLHTARALFECHSQASEACLMRVRLSPTEISPSQPVPASLVPRIWAFARANRPDLAGVDVILVDLVCDYIGRKSPPYGIEDVHCMAQQPRATNEAIFEGRAAEEMGEGLRGNTLFGTKKVVLDGALVCQWFEASSRAVCVTRALVDGVLQEKMIEMSPVATAQAARVLRQAAVDHAQLGGAIGTTGKAGGAVVVPPTEVMSVLKCTIDNSKVETAGKRVYVCRAKL